MKQVKFQFPRNEQGSCKNGEDKEARPMQQGRCKNIKNKKVRQLQRDKKFEKVPGHLVLRRGIQTVNN